MKSTKNFSLSDIQWKKYFDLIKGYFLHSDNKWRAWLLLLGAVSCVMASVGLILAISWISTGLWAALLAYNASLFLISAAEIGCTVLALVGINSLKNYLVGKLSIAWRAWLTQQLTHELSEHHLNIKHIHADKFGDVSSRIQEDVQNMINQTLTLGLEFVRSSLGLVVFTGVLWVIGGALSFTLLGLNIVIPGFLVWVALLTSLLVTGVTYLIGKSLSSVKKESIAAEASLRSKMEPLNTKSEVIAQEHAEIYFRTSMITAQARVQDVSEKKLKIQTRLSAFQDLYSNLTGFIPIFIASPLYFSGALDAGAFSQIGMIFFEVSMSLNWFANSYDNLSSLWSSVSRVLDLKQAFQYTPPHAELRMKIRDKESIRVRDLSLFHPQDTLKNKPLLHLPGKLVLKPGEHVLIQGDSGIGKSTLFRALSGIWKYGTGKISLPKDKRLYFLPQEPLLPEDTLKAVLAFPEPADTYTEPQYQHVLNVVHLVSLIPDLNTSKDWSGTHLSGGEKQRIAFARVLLKKPDWLFLDEATANLSEQGTSGQEEMYRILKKELSETTIVSIAHRDVRTHHDRILFFGRKQDNEHTAIHIQEYAHKIGG